MKLYITDAECQNAKKVISQAQNFPFLIFAAMAVVGALAAFPISPTQASMGKEILLVAMGLLLLLGVAGVVYGRDVEVRHEARKAVLDQHVARARNLWFEVTNSDCGAEMDVSDLVFKCVTETFGKHTFELDEVEFLFDYLEHSPLLTQVLEVQTSHRQSSLDVKIEFQPLELVSLWNAAREAKLLTSRVRTEETKSRWPSPFTVATKRFSFINEAIGVISTHRGRIVDRSVPTRFVAVGPELEASQDAIFKYWKKFYSFRPERFNLLEDQVEGVSLLRDEMDKLNSSIIALQAINEQIAALERPPLHVTLTSLKSFQLKSEELLVALIKRLIVEETLQVLSREDQRHNLMMRGNQISKQVEGMFDSLSKTLNKAGVSPETANKPANQVTSAFAKIFDEFNTGIMDIERSNPETQNNLTDESDQSDIDLSNRIDPPDTSIRTKL